MKNALDSIIPYRRAVCSIDGRSDSRQNESQICHFSRDIFTPIFSSKFVGCGFSAGMGAEIASTTVASSERVPKSDCTEAELTPLRSIVRTSGKLSDESTAAV